MTWLGALAILVGLRLIVGTLIFTVGYIVIGSAIDRRRERRQAEWALWEEEALALLRKDRHMRREHAQAWLRMQERTPAAFESSEAYLKAVSLAAHTKS